jgi:DcuC family C4-dicarboxylate transporter
MIGIAIGSAVTLWVGYLIVKKYKPQAALLLGALVLMGCSILLRTGQILPPKQSTGLAWFDAFDFIRATLSTRTAGLGLLIMSVAGFARYMDHIGASKALVNIAVKPLAKLRAPYVVLSAGYVVGQILALFIPSAAGLGVLLMVTMYPILVSLGVSRLSAAAMIGTTQSLDIGPASGNSILSATNAGMTIAQYFVRYQIPVGLCVVATVAILHYVVQRWRDQSYQDMAPAPDPAAGKQTGDAPPAIYAVLPMIPLALILGFSDLGLKTIKMDVVTAMLISTSISMAFEYIRRRDAKTVFGSLQVFFDGMGVQFATVITLIVAGEAFGQGLKTIGAVDSIIHAAQGVGFGGGGMILVMTGIITISAVVMGSGNAPFFAFASLAPAVAKQLAIAPVLMLLPMQFGSSIARSVSPITAVIVAVSGIANLSPVEVVKRTAIPMAGAMAVNVIASFVLMR